MPWTTTVRLDEDKVDIGTASATFVDPVRNNAVFSVSERVQINIAGRDAFIAEVIARRNEWQARYDSEQAKNANLLSALQAADQ